MGKYQKKPIKLEVLLIAGFLLHTFITWSYARSATALYATAEILIMGFSFYIFVRKIQKIDNRIVIISLALFILSLLTGVFINNEPKSMIMTISSIFFMSALSTVSIDTKHLKSAVFYSSILSLAVAYAQIATNFLGTINSNTLSFLVYGGVSLAFIWYELSGFKPFPMLFLAASLFVFFQTGSRNVAIVIIFLFALMLVPRKVLQGKVVYRLLYGGALGYTVLATRIMSWGFSNPRIASLLNDYVSFSQKSWGIESRTEFLSMINQNIHQLDTFTKLFGEGYCGHFAHNLFYQCIFVWGYVGAILIYLMMIIIFEMGYKEVKKGNILVLGCVLSLVGHIIINGADIYLFGGETCAVMPMLMFGIIMQQYMHGKQEEEQRLKEVAAQASKEEKKELLNA